MKRFSLSKYVTKTIGVKDLEVLTSPKFKQLSKRDGMTEEKWIKKYGEISEDLKPMFVDEETFESEITDDIYCSKFLIGIYPMKEAKQLYLEEICRLQKLLRDDPRDDMEFATEEEEEE